MMPQSRIIEVLPQIAQQQSVQEFAPPDNSGIFFLPTTQRGPILPEYGTKVRDVVLRWYDHHDYNGLWSGAKTGLKKKIKATEWELVGDDQKTIIIVGVNGEEREVIALQYYTRMLQEAQFGQGWGVYIDRFLDDYFCQDFGGITELIGPGHPSEPMLGAVTNIAHLDAGRSYVTGNPTYPILYYSLMTGKLHRMHHTRVIRFVDSPSPDERYFGIGFCALSRSISIVQREIRMNQYIDMSLDDKPKPGFAMANGFTKGQRDQMVAEYQREQQNDERPVFGKTMWMHSVDPENKADVKMIGFAQTPDKFDFIKYKDEDINEFALALGVDRQELWELTGRAMGSGAQSQVLAEKARGKAYADILQGMTRMINIGILPDFLEFRFKQRDIATDSAQADVDLKYAQIAQIAVATGILTDEQARQLLMNKSASFKDALTDEKNDVALSDDDTKTPNQIASADSSAAASGPTKPPAPTPPKPAVQKAFSATSADFTSHFIDILTRLSKGRIDTTSATVYLRSALKGAGERAYLDGKRDGGVNEPLDDDERVEVLDWLSNQDDYLAGIITEVSSKALPDLRRRAALWVNMSLTPIYFEGKMSADKNGLYEWVLGQTEKHCDTCLRLNGQVHRFKEFYKRRLVPKSNLLLCGGFNCDCILRRTTGVARGRF